MWHHYTILGIVGIAFASSGLSQALQDELIPEGTTPIAAFLTNPTEQDPKINATSATFAETAAVIGMFRITYMLLSTARFKKNPIH